MLLIKIEWLMETNGLYSHDKEIGSMKKEKLREMTVSAVLAAAVVITTVTYSTFLFPPGDTFMLEML